MDERLLKADLFADAPSCSELLLAYVHSVRSSLPGTLQARGPWHAPPGRWHPRRIAPGNRLVQSEKGMAFEEGITGAGIDAGARSLLQRYFSACAACRCPRSSSALDIV